MAAPAFLSAALAANGLALTVAFTVSGTQPLLPATGVTGLVVKVDGVTVAQASAARATATTILVTLSAAVKKNHTVTVQYAPGNITDTDVTALATFTAQAVTNSSTVTSKEQASAEAMLAWLNEEFGQSGLELAPTAVYTTTDGRHITRSSPPSVVETYTFATGAGNVTMTVDVSGYIVEVWLTAAA